MSAPLIPVVLEFVDVVKTYGEHRALDSVSLSVRAGEVFGLLGANGAGKTSLIRLALDIVRPDSGHVRVFGEEPSAHVLDRIGYLPEERGLYKTERVIDVLVYLGELKGLTRNDARRRALAWLERIGLDSVASSRVASLSKGMSQKVQLVAALISDPPLAILDEPFSGLDPVNARLVSDLILERRDRGLTTILSTHQMDRAELLCDRIAFVRAGKIVLEGTVAAIRSRHTVAGECPTLESIFVSTSASRSATASPAAPAVLE